VLVLSLSQYNFSVKRIFLSVVYLSQMGKIAKELSSN